MGTNTLSSATTTGIALYAGGTYLSPFTITSIGTIAAAGTYGVYSPLGGASLLNQGMVSATNATGYGVQFVNGGTVTNAGMIAGGGVATDFAATSAIAGTGLVLTNAEGSQETLALTGSFTGANFAAGSDGGLGTKITEVIETLSTSISTGITLTADGLYASPFTVAQTGTISTTDTYAVYSALSAATLLNHGVIAAKSSYGYGVKFNDGGYVSNIGAASTISGGYYAIDIENGPGTVLNAGTIKISNRYDNTVLLTGGGTVSNIGTASVITGGTGVDIENAPGTVFNAGKITGTFSYGVYTGYDGFVSNTGAAATISGSATGVFIGGDSGTIQNSGTITGKNALGVLLTGGGYVANLGTAASILGASGGVYIETGLGTVLNEGMIRAWSAPLDWIHL
jgi:hypothetical protein